MMMTGAALVLLAAGCATAGDRTTTAPTPAPAADPPSALASGPAGKTCGGTAMFVSSTGFREVRGESVDAELWGLLFAEVPFEAGAEVKIVWRMTGEGPLRAVASRADGREAELVWLEDHGGSSWRRPGHEWGTGWVFPEAGCWKVELTRTRGSGQVWLDVR
jgi:hypothetical protein